MKNWEDVEEACDVLGGEYDEETYTGFFEWDKRCSVGNVEFGEVGGTMFVTDECGESGFSEGIGSIMVNQNGLFINPDNKQMNEAGYGTYYRNSGEMFRTE